MRTINIIAAVATTLSLGCAMDADQGVAGGTGPGGFISVSSGGISTVTSTGGGFGDVSTGGIVTGVPFDEPLVVADTPPPPLSGGTLIVTASGHHAALSDPDHDQVIVVDLDAFKILTTIALGAGDEPGRLVEDGAGRLHVALRAAGAVATLDPVAGQVLSRDAVCAYPRGLAYDAASDVVHVACATGQLVTMPAAGGAATRTVVLDRDLRDVIVQPDGLVVTRMRSAELLIVGADGKVSARVHPPGTTSIADANTPSFTPAVAWRAVGAPGGGVLVVYQEHQSTDVQPQPGGYGGSGCGGIVRTAVSLFRGGIATWTAFEVPAVLPLDIALSPDGLVNVVAAGVPQRNTFTNSTPVVTFGQPASGTVHMSGCDFSGGDVSTGGVTTAGVTAGLAPMPVTQPAGQAVAIAFESSGLRLVQTREPYTLTIGDRAVILPGNARTDTGHRVFHLATPGGLACASCHPEGREDGHVWTFAGRGPRRTQSVGGGILGTEPFHWDGDMTDFNMLSHEVLTSRMSGPELPTEHAQAVANWIDRIPPLKADAPADAAAVDRGRVLFSDPARACISCHTGDKFTSPGPGSVDVGTGSPFQVPSLRGVSFRAPFMHDGCAPTLLDRFGSCGGGDKHGAVSSLAATQVADLVAYLETL